MKVYTGKGDKGKTSLFSGERVSKAHDRLEAYGDVDELNSFVGSLISALPDSLTDIADQLKTVQINLFKASAWLATTPDSSAIKYLEDCKEESAKELESLIDNMDKELDPLSSFILPGGDMAASFAHIARTICRRVERRIIKMADSVEPGKVAEQIRITLVYINRLSDYFFVLARYINKKQGLSDVAWNQ